MSQSINNLKIITERVLTKINFEFFLFNTTDKQYIQIIDDGTRIKSLHTNCKWVCVSSSIGWNKGIHRWQIKSNSSKPGYNAVGVCTNYLKATSAKALGKFGGSLYWDGYHGTIYRNDSTVVTSAEKWTTGDIIKITLNCNKWHVQFHKNDKLIGNFEITKKNKIYYPCLQMCACKGHDYQLLHSQLHTSS